MQPVAINRTTNIHIPIYEKQAILICYQDGKLTNGRRDKRNKMIGYLIRIKTISVVSDHIG